MYNQSIFFSRKLVFKIIAILFAVIITLVACEIILRLKGDTYSWSEKNGHGYLSPYDADCEIYWVSESSYKYDKIEYDYEVSVNKLGIRDHEHRLSKDSSVFRIIGLGDSFTEGAGAPVDSTWLFLLGNMYELEENDSVEVISGGVSGSDFTYSYVLFRDYLADYNPDIVIFVINNTDVADYFVRGGMSRYNGDTCFFKPAPPIEWLFKRSHLTRSVLLNVLKYNWQLVSPQERSKLWNDYSKELIDIAQTLKVQSLRDSFELCFVFHPLVHEINQGFYDYEFELLMSKLSEINVNSLDVYDALSNAAGGGDSISNIYWPIDQHLNSKGYRVFAEEVNKGLSQ